MSRVYRSATVRKFCERYGLTIEWQHEACYYRVSYKNGKSYAAFTKSQDDQYWQLNTNGIPIKGMRNLKGVYTHARGRKVMCGRMIGFSIDRQGRETFFIGFVEDKPTLGRPEDLGMFTQGFDGDMPVGVFRDWLIDGGYLDA